MNPDYQLRPGETPEQYKTRNNFTGVVATDTQDPLLSAIREKLTGAAEAVSSSQTGLEKSISAAMRGTKASTNAETARIESQFGRELGYAQNQAQNEFSNFSESRSGFGTQMAAFRNLVDTTDKYLSDLAQRKEELILQNEGQGAARIAELEMKALEYRQNAQQKVFDNLLGTANFDLNMRAEDRAGREFAANLRLDQQRLALQQDTLDKETQAKMAAIASEYGIEMREGDTLTDVVNRAAPIASAQKRAELNRVLAETNKIYADQNKDKARADMKAKVSEFVTIGWLNPATGKREKLTPSEAAEAAVAQLGAAGLELSVEDYNNAVKWGTEARETVLTDARRVIAESSNDYLDNYFRGGTGGGFQFGSSGASPVDTFSDWFSKTVLREEPNKDMRRYNELNKKLGKLSPGESAEWKNLDKKFNK